MAPESRSCTIHKLKDPNLAFGSGTEYSFSPGKGSSFRHPIYTHSPNATASRLYGTFAEIRKALLNSLYFSDNSTVIKNDKNFLDKITSLGGLDNIMLNPISLPDSGKIEDGTLNQ